MENKDSRSISEQVELLKDRGMSFNDEQKAFNILANISYYRLKGYWWDMQNDRTIHHFSPSSVFEDVVDRYNFDKKLRLILFDAIELIEIAFRTKMIYHMSQSYGGLWYLESDLANDPLMHATVLDELKTEFQRSKEIFAKDYRNKYPNGNPDAWIILEVASFGTLSKIFKNISHQLPEKSVIAKEFGLNFQNELSGWLEAISYIRNIIAHHSRLWSRNMVKRPTMPTNPLKQWLTKPLDPVQEKKPFFILSTMIYLCNSINCNHQIKNNILDLIEVNPNIPIYKIGFFNNWQTEPLWQR